MTPVIAWKVLERLGYGSTSKPTPQSNPQTPYQSKNPNPPPATPTSSSQNEILEKEIIKAIFKTERMLVYRHELELPEDYEIDNTYIFYKDENADFDVIMDPDIIKLDDKELNIFREIFVIDEDMDIDKVSELVTKYVTRKMQTCTKTGHVYSLLLEKAEKYFNVEKDDSEYNERTYRGKIKYIIKDGNTVLGTIIENIEYCNYCINDPMVSIGIQKCIEIIREEQS